MRRHVLVRGAAPPAALLALVVVAGVLAMHAIVGGSHGTGESPGHVTTAASSQGPHDMLPAGGATQTGILASLVERVDAVLSEPGPADPTRLAVPAGACLAMLLSALVSVRRARTHGLVRRCDELRPRRWSAAGAAPTGRPPDLLTELCVMRT